MKMILNFSQCWSMKIDKWIIINFCKLFLLNVQCLNKTATNLMNASMFGKKSLEKLLKVSPVRVSWNAGTISWPKFSAGFETSCSAAPSLDPPSPPSSSAWGARGGWGRWGRGTWSGGLSCATRRGRWAHPPPRPPPHPGMSAGCLMLPSWSQAVSPGPKHQEGSSGNTNPLVDLKAFHIWVCAMRSAQWAEGKGRVAIKDEFKQFNPTNHNICDFNILPKNIPEKGGGRLAFPRLSLYQFITLFFKDLYIKAFYSYLNLYKSSILSKTLIQKTIDNNAWIS